MRIKLDCFLRIRLRVAIRSIRPTQVRNHHKTATICTLVAALLLSWLRYSPSLALAQNPETTPEAESALSLGFHINRGDDLHLRAVRAAGGDFAVIVFSWANIEPEPNYLYWEEPDATLRAAEFYNVDIIARLDQPPTWSLDAGDPTPWRLEAYANFARRVAERYGDRLAGIVLWNEPNLSLEWNNQPPDAVAYVELLKATYPALKAVAPEVPVLLGGLASTEGEGDWAINDLDYLQALYEAGAAPYFDGLTAHPYGFGRPPSDPPQKFRPNFRRLELYRAIMTANNDAAKPIWVTEMGWLIRANEPRHEWQVVSPETQADYTLQAMAYAQQNYPWLTRLSLWELNSQGDAYGYGLWHGPDQSSSTYEALVDRCPDHSNLCDPAVIRPKATATADLDSHFITILKPDATIRLGDRDKLQPHWVHLHAGRLIWQGEFFLTAEQAQLSLDLLLETMQIDQSTNHLLINQIEVARLQARPRPDPTSTWVTQRIPLPPDLLQPGQNMITIKVGPRNAARQYLAGRWENMQFRHIRLIDPEPLAPSLLAEWQPQPSPSGWIETNRLRPGLNGDLWLTGLRPGQLWQLEAGTLVNQAANRPDLIFTDVLPLAVGALAATAQGLFWREAGQPAWQSVEAAPIAHAYGVLKTGDRFYAGFEAEGLWSASTPLGPWQRTALTAAHVIDLVNDGEGMLYAISPTKVFIGRDQAWQTLSLPALSDEELDEAGEIPGDKFKPRLYLAQDGRLVVRNQDRLWEQTVVGGADWQPLGPEKLQGKLFSLLNCCEAGMLIGTHDAGLWRFEPAGDWLRLDADEFFNTTDITELLQVGDRLYAAGDLGLFNSLDGRVWHKIEGLPPAITDVIVDSANPARWLAGTPAGLYRTDDAGRSWSAASPPWTIWDLAIGPNGRLYVGRSNGLATSDSWEPPFQRAEELEQVSFLRVKPHPVEPNLVWSGTWGNNIAVSSDGGQTVSPLHNGLETLSGLDLIWHATPGQVTLATFAGLYRTDDGGQSWFKLSGPLMNQTIYALHQTVDGAIWAGTGNGLWLSHDYGVTWHAVEALADVTVLRLNSVTVPSPSLLAPSPFVDRSRETFVYASLQWVWAGTEGAGLWLSSNQGETWHFAGLPGRTVYHLFFDPTQARRLIAATDQGLFAVTVSEADVGLMDQK